MSKSHQYFICISGEIEGRTSGSLAWRLARGETSNQNNFEPFIFMLSHDELERKEFVLKYSPSLDVYLREINEMSLQKLQGWKSGIFYAKNVFRKHEKDWKMVYIARSGCAEGEIAWKFDWGLTCLKIRSALVVFQHTCFEAGVVSWSICNDGDLCFIGNKEGVLELCKDDLAGSKYLELKAVLKGEGNGDASWQHSQLFRQKDHDPHFPFFIKLKFD
ncbi:Peptide-N(4)-(N-acetyl-beta-glucosaminyl)asparagine amidase [Armadillidium nasatum]|uniref:Peptide-N(4)-(N-acetyl-beta-glucosaminyl)asparagine amidase n=1 Tax=Armadillidium nasatum TaxID=96803 RepID=A0A5N5TM75_9CRUS|nr:Peptide-N(4)-(N-acetyl-beta-glucosaminyl)asparagine amidase [Armadillidium nasatum]